MDTYGKKLGVRIWSELNWYTRLSLGRQGSYVCRSDLVSLWCLTLPVGLPLQMFVCLPSCLSVCPSVCILVCLSVCPSVGWVLLFASCHCTGLGSLSVQFSMVSMRSEKPIYATPRLSQVSPPCLGNSPNSIPKTLIIPQGMLWSWRARKKHQNNNIKLREQYNKHNTTNKRGLL